MLNRLALDVPLVLEPNEVDFFTRATGLRDDALEEHIKSIQAKGYHDVTPFPCIRSFNFARFKISSHPIWPSVLARKDESDNLLLDLGCCFGTDVRKSIDDGWPSNAVLGAELMDSFISLGYELFKDTPTTAPPFLIGDVFSPSFLSLSIPSLPTLSSLQTITTLTPLKGHIRHLHAGSFFHLFDEQIQRDLVHLVALLLDPQPGSTIFGSHVATPLTGFRGQVLAGKQQMFCFSPMDWNQLWEKEFGVEKVKCMAKLVPKELTGMAPRAGTNDHWSGELLIWSVVLL